MTARGQHHVARPEADPQNQSCDLRHIPLGPGGRSRSITDSHGRLRTQPVVAGLPPAFAFGGSGVHRGSGAEQSCRRCRAERPVAPADSDHHHRSGAEPGNCASPAGHVPPPACAIGRVWTLYRFLRMQDKQEPIHTDQQSGPLPAPFTTRIPRGIHRCLVLPEGESPRTSGCAGRFGELSRTTSAAPSSCSVLTRFAAAVSGTSSLSRTCAPDLDISRRTPYERRVKDRAPRVHHVSERRPACPPLRISALAVCPFTCQAMTTDTRRQTCMPFYGKAGRFPSGTEGDYPAEKFWA